jgi:hypothetical protein
MSNIVVNVGVSSVATVAHLAYFTDKPVLHFLHVPVAVCTFLGAWKEKYSYEAQIVKVLLFFLP